MEAQKFVEIWDDNEFIRYNERILRKYKVSEENCEGLSKYGLPESAAPYLNFECVSEKKMENLEEGYFYLGYTGNGDWICLNVNTGNIIIIDREMYYNDAEDEDMDVMESEDIEEDGLDYEYEGYTLLNSSLNKLYEFLVIYKDFIKKNLKERTNCFENEIKNLELKFKSIDEEAMHIDDCFWNQEIRMLENS